MTREFSIAGYSVKALIVTLVVGIFLAGAPFDSRADEANDHELVFGFLPILSTEKLVARFGPLVDYLSEKLGQPVRLETAPDYAEFVRRTNEEKRYDLLFTAPHFYYLAQRKAGYRAIVRVAVPSMQAIIVAPRSGDIKEVSDLRGRRISTPDPLSLASVLIRDTLQQAGLDPDKDVMVVATPSHNASLISAQKGVTDAAGLMIPPFRHAKPELRDAMRIIAKSQSTPHMPICVGTTLTQDQARIVEDTLLGLTQTEDGQALLKHLSWPGFAKTTPEEYDAIGWAVRQLKL